MVLAASLLHHRAEPPGQHALAGPHFEQPETGAGGARGEAHDLRQGLGQLGLVTVGAGRLDGLAQEIKVAAGVEHAEGFLLAGEGRGVGPGAMLDEVQIGLELRRSPGGLAPQPVGGPVRRVGLEAHGLAFGGFGDRDQPVLRQYPQEEIDEALEAGEASELAPQIGQPQGSVGGDVDPPGSEILVDVAGAEPVGELGELPEVAAFGVGLGLLLVADQVIRMLRRVRYRGGSRRGSAPRSRTGPSARRPSIRRGARQRPPPPATRAENVRPGTAPRRPARRPPGRRRRPCCAAGRCANRCPARCRPGSDAPIGGGRARRPSCRRPLTSGRRPAAGRCSDRGPRRRAFRRRSTAR